eukprot:TRINITY_DN7890_c0_g1_i7.p1 TRINITY_DN7890_c0_g1~~TRINITY_DN7890_c0_g1_i7.p1  ORF type:complete len:327 (-),score=58.49 TRINITY_DN7890_c0_g1_i7:219-1199(-)
MQGASTVLAELKELKEDCVASIFPPSKGKKLQQMPDNFASMLSLIEEIREKLISDKMSIESLREAVNTLQGERQLLCHPGNITDRSLNAANNLFGFGERELMSTSGQERHRATIQKYISWFDSIQAPLKEIVSVANGEASSSEMTGKYSLAQMREIISKVPEAIAQLKRARASEAKSSSATIRSLRLECEALKRAREREIQQSLSESISAFNSLQEELIKAKEVIKKLEEQLRKSREAYDLAYEKGTPSSNPSTGRARKRREGFRSSETAEGKGGGRAHRAKAAEGGEGCGSAENARAAERVQGKVQWNGRGSEGVEQRECTVGIV